MGSVPLTGADPVPSQLKPEGKKNSKPRNPFVEIEPVLYFSSHLRR